MTKQIKVLTYSLSTVVLAAAFGVIAYCALDFTLIFSLLMAVGGGLVASCISRVILHLTFEDNSAEMWQVAIYHGVIAFGWFVFVLAPDWGFTTFGAAVVVGASMMCLFTRFLTSPEGKVAVAMETAEREDRYFPEGDVVGAKPDQGRPVCCIDGVNYTIAEAEEKGYKAEAEAARQLLRAVYEKSLAVETKEKK